MSRERLNSFLTLSATSWDRVHRSQVLDLEHQEAKTMQKTKSTEVPTSTIPADLTDVQRALRVVKDSNGNEVYVADGNDYSIPQAVIAQSDANTKRVIESGRNELTLGELEAELEKINDQLEYWDKVKADASANLSGLYPKKTAADRVLAEIPATSKRSQDRSDRERAEATLEHVGWRITKEEKRVTNANAQISTWEARKAAFPKDTLKKLRAEEKRRERLVSTVSHVSGRSR
jgi:hypothetical protein